MKVQNGGYIHDGVENVYIFHSIFSEMIFLLISLLDAILNIAAILNFHDWQQIFSNRTVLEV
jgi:hypothetical protein